MSLLRRKTWVGPRLRNTGSSLQRWSVSAITFVFWAFLSKATMLLRLRPEAGEKARLEADMAPPWETIFYLNQMSPALAPINCCMSIHKALWNVHASNKDQGSVLESPVTHMASG